MRTFPIKHQDGTLHAFEVPNTFLFGGTIERILLSVPSVSAIQRGPNRELRFRFQFAGVPCVVEEPYGDSSRYWVGPDDATRQDLDPSPLANAFQKYASPLASLVRRLSIRTGS
jgi:hypothetical protein